MKRKIIFIIILVLLLAACLSVYIFNRDHKLIENGNFYENIDNFVLDGNKDEMSELSKSYLSSISYTIVDVNRKDMTVNLDINIPVVESNLMKIIEQVTDSDKELSYTELKKQVQSALIDELSSGQFETKTASIQLPLQREGLKYKILGTEELSNLIYEDLVKAYTGAVSKYGGDN